MYAPSHGGNAFFQTGQVTLQGPTTPVKIPIPPRLAQIISQTSNPDFANTANFGSATLYMTGAASDAWYGDNTLVGGTADKPWSNPLTNLTGKRIPSNATDWMTAPRVQVWVVGAVGDVISYSWEWN